MAERKEAMYYEKLDGGRVRCRLCPHSCTIADGKTGLAGTDHDDVEQRRSDLGGHVVTAAGSRRDTSKLNIIPL